MDINQLIALTKFTILLGKNGAGKSTLLRSLSANGGKRTNYISPERGGVLRYDAGMENNILGNGDYLKSARNRNRTENFREQSTAQFRNLELITLREIEQDNAKRADITYSFNTEIDKLNTLLPAIQLVRTERGFSIQSRAGEQIPEDSISSGEAELIALAIEVLVYSRSQENEKILLLDEPDVHLHPDLQQKFIEFVEFVASTADMKVVIATHSTAIIGAFSKAADLQIIPVSKRGQLEFDSFRNSQVSNEILPVFGAHPLSSMFNKSPILLVEGEDDRRVIEELVRTSNGRYKYYPCVVGTVADMYGWESWLNSFLPAIYDTPKAYSLRDLDRALQTDIVDLGIVCRVRLNCYAIENILVTNECFKMHGISADEFLASMTKWTETFPQHTNIEEVQDFIANFEQRREFKIKSIRNIIVALLESSKPWEIIVARCIATSDLNQNNEPHSIYSYLGKKAVDNLFR